MIKGAVLNFEHGCLIFSIFFKEKGGFYLQNIFEKKTI